MAGWIFRRWLALKGSGWFSSSMTGGIFPFPETSQGWLAFGMFVVALAATSVARGELVMLARIAMCVLYIALGFITYA